MPGQGVTSKAAFKIEGTTAWGTSTDCGSDDQIHFISESVSHAIEQAQAIHNDGNVGAKSLYPIFKKYGGDVLVEAHYAGLEQLVAMAVGMSHQTLSPVSTSTSANEHYFSPSADMSTRAFNGYEMTSPSGNAQRRGSLCFEKDTSVWELASAMCNAMTFEAGPERITFSFTLAGKTITFDSATNPNSASWSLPSNTEQISWEDMTLYLKARDQFTIAAANDTFIIDDGGGDVTLDIADGTYTGYELCQAIVAAANADADVDGVYKMEYDEHLRKFRIYTTDGQTFSVSGASMQMAATVGMTVDSSTAIETRSDSAAIVDSFAAFTTTDKIGASKITWALENNLDIESQDSESDLNIIEPERNGMRRLTGTIEIPRYKNDTFLKAVSGYTTYELWINFTGSAIDSESYEMNIHMPAVRFTNADAPITGAELIKQTLAFEAEVPDIIDWVNHAFNSYLTITSDTTTNNIIDIAVGPDGIYTAQGAGTIEIWNPLDGTFSTSTDTGTNAWGAIKAFGNKMFVGDSAGEIYVQENGAWSSNCDIGAGDVRRFEGFNDEFFCLEGSTGKVFYYPDEDTNWSLSCDTTSTDANGLITYNGNLYMVGSDGSTFTRVYEFDGATHLTGWTTSTDIGTGSAIQAVAIHDGKLYVSHAGVLNSFDGTTWTVVDASIGISPESMHSWKGHLIMIPTGAGADLYYYDFKTGAAVAINSGLNLSSGQPSKIIEGKLFMTQSATSIKIQKPVQELLMTIQNQNSTNPL